MCLYVEERKNPSYTHTFLVSNSVRFIPLSCFSSEVLTVVPPKILPTPQGGVEFPDHFRHLSLLPPPGGPTPVPHSISTLGLTYRLVKPTSSVAYTPRHSVRLSIQFQSYFSELVVHYPSVVTSKGSFSCSTFYKKEFPPN